VSQIKRVPIPSQIEDYIRELIASERYRPGMKLPTESEFCSTLGVGRGSVREAFRLMQAKGLVEIKPGRGAFVAEPGSSTENALMWLVQNESDLRDFIEIRNALEPLAAAKMAQTADEKQIAALKDIHSRFLVAVKSGSSSRIASLDELFHSTIVRCSRNSLLIDIESRLTEGLRTFRSNTFTLEDNVRNAVEPHSRILEAIANHDSEKAQYEMNAHLRLVGDDLTRNIHSI